MSRLRIWGFSESVCVADAFRSRSPPELPNLEISTSVQPTLLCIANSIFLVHHLTCYTFPVLAIANVIIHGGTFNSAKGDLHFHNRDPEFGMYDFRSVLKSILYRWSNKGLHILILGVSLVASHDAAERYPPPNGHPDTRKTVRQIILCWTHNENLTCSFFWLYGPGAGRTAILQAVSESLCNPSGSSQSFGGSFSFLEGDDGHFLFSTIAYQLALKVPGLRQWPYNYKTLLSIRSNISSTPFLSCYHRWFGWIPWQGDPTVGFPSPVRNDHSS